VRTLEIIGIGRGDPEQLTLQAVAALGRVDVVLLVDKGETTRDLVDLRTQILHRHGPRVTGSSRSRTPGGTAAARTTRAR
jgi:precorrin-6A synthase